VTAVRPSIVLVARTVTPPLIPGPVGGPLNQRTNPLIPPVATVVVVEVVVVVVVEVVVVEVVVVVGPVPVVDVVDVVVVGPVPVVDVVVVVVVVVVVAAAVVVVVSVGPTIESHPLITIPNPTIETANNPIINLFIIFPLQRDLLGLCHPIDICQADNHPNARMFILMPE